MRSICLKNKEVINHLDSWVTFFKDQDRSKMQKDDNIVSLQAPYDYTISEQYLREQIALGTHNGFPPSMKGVELYEFWGKQFWDEKWTKEVNKILYGLNALLNTKRNALCAYYPPGGYIGWHNNANAPGYNILFTWSETGEGYFEYLDPKTDKVVRMQDEKGWTCKAGYYGSFEEPEQQMWHAASTDCERLTFAYIVPDKFMWEEMLDDIASEEFY